MLGGGGYSVGASLLGVGIPLVATLGGLAAATLVYGLSWRQGVDSFRLILIGIGVTDLCDSHDADPVDLFSRPNQRA